MIRKLFCWWKSIYNGAFHLEVEFLRENIEWQRNQIHDDDNNNADNNNNQYEPSNVKGWTQFHFWYEMLVLEMSSHPSVRTYVRIAAQKATAVKGAHKRWENLI